MNNYIIVFDQTQLQFDLKDIHRYITSSPEVSDWWHYLPNVYIITTSMSAKKMTDTMAATYPGLRFFMSRLDFSDYNGILKFDAWEWIKKKTKQVFNLKPAAPPPTYTLNDLLKRHNQTISEKTERKPLDDLLKLISEDRKK